MGGYGSGRWFGRGRQQIVENCLTVSADELPIITKPDETIWLPVKEYGGRYLGSLRCEMIRLDAETSALSYQLPQGDQILRQIIPLGSTAVRAGGSRVSFLCPVAVGNGFCGRVCRILYAPPGSYVLGCRGCHRLSYASSQRRAERLKRADRIADDLIDEAHQLFERVESGETVSFAELMRVRKRLSNAGFDLWELAKTGGNEP